jgi:uncharacterized membrane protein YecN with MAPEG domain
MMIVKITRRMKVNTHIVHDVQPFLWYGYSVPFQHYQIICAILVVMILPVTMTTAVILTVLYCGLALWVIALRRTGVGPSVGAGHDERFLRAMRAHGNFSEYAPLFLILLGLAETARVSFWFCVGCVCLFVAGRCLHIIGFGLRGAGPGRTLGMVATLSSLMVLAITLLITMIGVSAKSNLGWSF